MRVQAAAPEHFAWIAARTGCVLTSNARAIEAVDRSGVIVGMVAYDLWTENSVTAHMAVDYPLVWRSLMRPACSYPFEEARKGVVIGSIRASNTRSLSTAKHMGFREIARVRDLYAVNDDAVLIEMRREDCRWIKREQAND